MEYIQIIKEKYPYMISKEEGFTYSTYCFSKDKNHLQRMEPNLFYQQIDLTKGKNKVDSTIEYGPSYTLKLSDIISDRHSIITISAKLFSSDITANPVLVMDIQDNGKSLDWRGSEYINYNNNTNHSNTVYLSADLTSFNLKTYPYAEAKIYIWNRNKKNLLIDDFKINITEGNHLLYSLYEPIN